MSPCGYVAHVHFLDLAVYAVLAGYSFNAGRAVRRCFLVTDPGCRRPCAGVGVIRVLIGARGSLCEMRHVFPQGKHAARRGMNRKLLQEEYKGGILMIRRTMFVLLLRSLRIGRLQRCRRPGPAGVRSPMGPQLQHPGLEPDVPLSVRLLSAELLGHRLLSQQRGPVLPLSARNAHSGVPQAVAELLSAAPQRPGDQGTPVLPDVLPASVTRASGTTRATTSTRTCFDGRSELSARSPDVPGWALTSPVTDLRDLRVACDGQ